MTEQRQETAGTGRTSIALTPAVRERLAQLERAVMVKQGRYMPVNDVVSWMLDMIDAADLP